MNVWQLNILIKHVLKLYLFQYDVCIILIRLVVVFLHV